MTTNKKYCSQCMFIGKKSNHSLDMGNGVSLCCDTIEDKHITYIIFMEDNTQATNDNYICRFKAHTKDKDLGSNWYKPQMQTTLYIHNPKIKNKCNDCVDFKLAKKDRSH